MNNDAKPEQSRFTHLSLLCLIWLLASSAHAATAPADHIFLGDHIITMAATATASAQKPTALAIHGDQIVWTGERKDHGNWLGADTEVHELGDRALLPGFIDAHGHLTYLAATLKWANLASPPVGQVVDMSTLQGTLADYITEQAIPPGTWVIGNGYDDSLLKEQRHPDRDDLDAVSSQHPIALIHVSGHLTAVNSAALRTVNIDAETLDPAGGHIRRRPGSSEPNGVLEETATYPIRAVMQQPSGNPITDIETALNVYASNGITTAQDGAIGAGAAELLSMMDRDQLLTLDVVIYPIVGSPAQDVRLDYRFSHYQNRLKVGGVKLILDGSPQGKTAYLSAPYAVPPPGQNQDYLGYPTHTAAAVDAMVGHYLSHDIPVIAHANGDAAAQMLIDAVAAAGATEPVADHRTVMIHAQTVREDQLDQMARLGIVPSYFSAHTFYWGDWHRDSVLGVERAQRISPTRSSAERGMPFTVHNDTPIVPPDMLRLLWATTNRLTRSGQVLGAKQRLNTYEALVAITRDAAYQYFEEDRKGTLVAGKLADLVVLSGNPLELDRTRLLELDVPETWSHGTRVFER